MMDALTLLRAYLAGDETAIMSRAHVEAVIAEIERLRARQVRHVPRPPFESAEEVYAEIDRLTAELAAERERAEFYHAGQHTYQDRLEDAEAELAAADYARKLVEDNRDEWQEAAKKARAELAAEQQQRQQEYEETARQINEAVCALAAERERAGKYQRLAAELSDKLNGTPCAEIRWQQERAKLREALERAKQSMDDILAAQPMWEGGVRGPSAPALQGCIASMRDAAKVAFVAICAALAETGGDNG
jgi:chromosome segregation ATPase